MVPFFFQEQGTLDDLLLNALTRVRVRAGGPGGRAYLAAIGNWLRDEGIDVSRLRPLSGFLRTLGGFCHISGDMVVFEGGQPDTTPGAGISEPEPSLIEAEKGYPPSFVLRSDLWRALVNGRTKSVHYLDLSTLNVQEVEQTATEGPVFEEPERYLTIPTVSTEEQRTFVVEQLRPSMEPASVELIASANEDWMRVFFQEAPLDLQHRVLLARRSWIVEKAQKWLRSHGIPEDRFVSMRRQQKRTGRDGSARLVDDAFQRLREALHRAIDRMTPEELENLRVPARLLID